MVIYVTFLRDVARQKLLKSANVSRSYSQNNTGTVFFETRCIYSETIQQRFTVRSGVLPALTVGSAEQLAVAHCPNERTLDPQYQLDRPTYVPASRTMVFISQCFHSLFLAASITRYQLLLIYQPQRDRRLSWPEHHECKCLFKDLTAVLVGHYTPKTHLLVLLALAKTNEKANTLALLLMCIHT